MKQFLKRFPDALVRLGAVFAVLIAVVLLVRSVLPPSVTDTRYQQQATVEREAARSIRYAGSGICADCHDEANVKRTSFHRNLSCETCHGPAREHADNPSEVKPSLPRLREFCVRCHSYDRSRPTGFPQINPAAHNPLKACISCHNPHDPKPPKAPQECQGCHAEIARTKALSPHVLLECTTCHEVPSAHRTTPRAVLASIPKEREFCGRCHATTAAVRETPKVDIATHGEKYLCWQCHYPHMPEVK